ncbi:MarR family transcriptional regulator [Rhodanobacter sp. DHB23]|uniref:MarR family winged helix-turn-helix transcriptional regulator n=1 Tax=Rhodanobacter sp. DHB23 TaxID=2775923 RepID=UPI0017870569|nr:MarR family transcriptional regulator [Rhodanobacter sp. DHB23]MBD8872517.1 MarR family transcriptional regulator [Rhodanobacter sp. DHB23]
MKTLRHDPRIAQTQATARELRALIGKLKRQLREKVGIMGLTLSQTSVLIHLERQGSATVSELARAENVRPQSMGATVLGLQVQGLVDGVPDPNDGRRTLLSLTPLAHEKIRANRTAREDWLFQAIRDRFDASEQDALARGVELLKRLAEG